MTISRGIVGTSSSPFVTEAKLALELAPVTDAALMGWALVQAFRPTAPPIRNADQAVVSMSFEWPDGTAGSYTATALSTAFPGATDAWSATYVGAVTKTVTQPAVTRDSNGAVTVQPSITIT